MKSANGYFYKRNCRLTVAIFPAIIRNMRQYLHILEHSIALLFRYVIKTAMATCDQFEYLDEDSVDPDLICIICNRPLFNPVCTPCDHTFCSGCISKWIDTNTSSCGTCALPLSLDDIKPASRTIRNIVDRIRIRCLLCGQTGLERGGFRDHLKLACPNADVECVAANVKCEWTGKRNQLDDHLTTCAFYSCRPVIISIIDENKQLKEQMQLHTAQISQLQADEQHLRTENARLVQQRAQDQAEIQTLTQRVNSEYSKSLHYIKLY
jgi:hypothetical protein